MILILTIVFVVLMCLWLFGGGYIASQGAAFNFPSFGGYTLIPWLCVAILGYLVLSGASTVIVHQVR